MGVYDIDQDKVIKENVPVRLRKLIRLAWLRALAAGIKNLYNQFMAYRAKRVYELKHNSQVCKMEAALNDMFDAEDRLIYIADGPFADALPVYLVIEEKPVPLALDSELPVGGYEAPRYLYTDLETAELGWQFIVYYPDGLVFDMARMRALIDKYRLPSKWVYDIRSYTP